MFCDNIDQRPRGDPRGVGSRVYRGAGGLLAVLGGSCGLLLVRVTDCSTTEHRLKTSSISSSIV